MEDPSPDSWWPDGCVSQDARDAAFVVKNTNSHPFWHQPHGSVGPHPLRGLHFRRGGRLFSQQGGRKWEVTANRVPMRGMGICKLPVCSKQKRKNLDQQHECLPGATARSAAHHPAAPADPATHWPFVPGELSEAQCAQCPNRTDLLVLMLLVQRSSSISKQDSPPETSADLG